MKTIDLKAILKANTAVLFYFYNDNCAPCKILRPKVQQMVDEDFPNIKFHLINTELQPVISAQFGVFSSPTLIVFFEEKEYIRESKNISISELHDKIERIYTMIF